MRGPSNSLMGVCCASAYMKFFAWQDIVRELAGSHKEGKEGLLSREPAIVAQYDDASPDNGAEHENNADVVRKVSQPMVPFQQIQHRQNVVPVVSIGFFARHSTDEHEVKRPRIVDVGRDIHHALRRPPQGHRSPKWIPGLHQECAKTNDRHENLAERSSENRHEATERHEDHMSGFMKGKIDQVKKRITGIVRFEGRHDELQTPPAQHDEHNRTTVESHRIGRRILLNQPLLDCQKPPHSRR